MLYYFDGVKKCCLELAEPVLADTFWFLAYYFLRAS